MSNKNDSCLHYILQNHYLDKLCRSFIWMEVLTWPCCGVVQFLIL